MWYQWEFRLYRRRFKQGLKTNHGVWMIRDGIILRLVDKAGNIGWGEIAPIPWFGSETIEQALAFCYQLPATLTDNCIFSISDTLPSCQFGFESAWESVQKQAIDQTETQRRRDAKNQALFATENLTLQAQSSDVAAQSSASRPQNSDVAVQDSKAQPQRSDSKAPRSTASSQPSKLAAYKSPLPSPPYSALLPAGEATLHAWKPLWEKGFRTFKWKIGVSTIAAELKILHSLAQRLPKTAKLRLDANGGLSTDDAVQWLYHCDAINANLGMPVEIEYVEQPLQPSQFQAMQDLSNRYRTPIALDESVATLQQLRTCYESGWQGIFVIKPAIVGSPTRLRQFCQQHPLDAVFSSAFETAIGRQAGLQLAAALGNPDRALGYGTTHWFNDAELSDFEPLWQSL